MGRVPQKARGTKARNLGFNLLILLEATCYSSFFLNLNQYTIIFTPNKPSENDVTVKLTRSTI